ncbi:MAG: hypothetical protein K9W43_13115 [Candidatus Thorarchaeota archaeon]|nr:hypothetical protein [Candidatus Thorarchaeota archaeon]
MAKPRKRKPKVAVPETGRVVTGAAVAAAEADAIADVQAQAATETKSSHTEVVEEQWVRPSQVSRDRVRTTGKRRQQSELEKAREAFKKAESMGIEERMLRASEVKELFDEVGTPASSDAAPSPGGAESEAITSEPIHTIDAGAIDDSEVMLLGTMSPMVDSTGGSAMASSITSAPPPASTAPELTSSLYDSVEVDESKLPTVTPEETPVVEEAVPVKVEAPKPPTTVIEAKDEDEAEVRVCPQCGTIMYVDTFEYPPEVYAEMGNSRLKQARFFVVQGKYEQARKVIRIARALFTRAHDEKGLEQSDKLIESLARSA